MPLDSFYTPLKHQKNSTFQMFLGGGGVYKEAITMKRVTTIQTCY